MSTARALPPGQRRIEGFPRFGTHLHRPPPPTPRDHHIEVMGADMDAFVVPLPTFRALPRVSRTRDFHCVGGWTATDVHWEGVTFPTFYEHLIAPRLATGTEITHFTFGGLDGYRSVVCAEDVMDDDVLLVDVLDGEPLSPDHGAPLRLVSPKQYGFISTKHLSLIELHTVEPDFDFGAASSLARLGLRLIMFRRHPRSRVWLEERHGYLPGPVVRLFYRPLIPLIRRVSATRSLSRAGFDGGSHSTEG
ncbi:molybdopterin-dependent oxidoreductase [Mumia zhuanghuii]|uniref:Reductase n=1 Tax=Mumia zhuanghuii TaxID=2585211 RepID=A0A5C4MUQ9_9ACTN|nr:molybdopterin-dependent oxidoreductase [Mumia zhuanghuii]TNC32973.1 reductase [Mumia zhuanghuii]TNC49675.1 reductase [Mumia zhuanghuii]